MTMAVGLATKGSVGAKSFERDKCLSPAIFKIARVLPPHHSPPPFPLKLLISSPSLIKNLTSALKPNLPPHLHPLASKHFLRISLHIFFQSRLPTIKTKAQSAPFRPKLRFQLAASITAEERRSGTEAAPVPRRQGRAAREMEFLMCVSVEDFEDHVKNEGDLV